MNERERRERHPRPVRLNELAARELRMNGCSPRWWALAAAYVAACRAEEARDTRTPDEKRADYIAALKRQHPHLTAREAERCANGKPIDWLLVVQRERDEALIATGRVTRRDLDRYRREIARTEASVRRHHRRIPVLVPRRREPRRPRQARRLRRGTAGTRAGPSDSEPPDDPLARLGRAVAVFAAGCLLAAAALLTVEVVR